MRYDTANFRKIKGKIGWRQPKEDYEKMPETQIDKSIIYMPQNEGYINF